MIEIVKITPSRLEKLNVPVAIKISAPEMPREFLDLPIHLLKPREIYSSLDTKRANIILHIYYSMDTTAENLIELDYSGEIEFVKHDYLYLSSLVGRLCPIFSVKGKAGLFVELIDEETYNKIKKFLPSGRKIPDFYFSIEFIYGDFREVSNNIKLPFRLKDEYKIPKQKYILDPAFADAAESILEENAAGSIAFMRYPLEDELGPAIFCIMYDSYIVRIVLKNTLINKIGKAGIFFLIKSIEYVIIEDGNGGISFISKYELKSDTKPQTRFDASNTFNMDFISNMSERYILMGTKKMTKKRIAESLLSSAKKKSTSRGDLMIAPITSTIENITAFAPIISEDSGISLTPFVENMICGNFIGAEEERHKPRPADWVQILLNGKVIGGIEVSADEPLFRLREIIKNDNIETPAHYSFVYNNEIMTDEILPCGHAKKNDSITITDTGSGIIDVKNSGKIVFSFDRGSYRLLADVRTALENEVNYKFIFIYKGTPITRIQESKYTVESKLENGSLTILQ